MILVTTFKLKMYSISVLSKYSTFIVNNTNKEAQ